MKSIITILLVFIVNSVSAQQITKNGSRYQFAIGQNITKDGARYKFAEEIYTSYEIGEILASDAEAKWYYDSFRSKLKESQNILILGSTITLGSIGHIYFFEDKSDATFRIPKSVIVLGVGIIIDIIGLGTSANAYRNLNQGIRIFNRHQDGYNKLSFTVELGNTSSGLGATLKF